MKTNLIHVLIFINLPIDLPLYHDFLDFLHDYGSKSWIENLI